LEAGHWHIAKSGGSLRFLKVDKVGVLVDLIEVQLVEIAHACEDDTVAEFADIVEMLLKDWRIYSFWDLIGLVLGQSWELALG
jgi:hypothetical protein